MRKDEGKTKEQLLNELEEMRQRIKELKASEAERKRAQEELRSLLERESTSAREWQELFDTSMDVIALISPDFEILRINRAGYESIGKKREELVGKKCYEVVHGLHSPIDGCPCQDLIRTKRAGVGEITQGGRYYIATASPILDKNDELIAFTHTIKDITERKQAEEVLKESEEKYKSLVNNIKLGIFRSTPEPMGKFLEVNPAMEEITGYSREELLKMDVSKLYVYPEERGATLEEMASATGKTTKELCFRKKDGTKIVVSDTKVAVRDDGGRILYFDGIIEDITERKQAEEALQESEERYRDLFENANDLVQSVAPDGHFLYVNKAWRQILGYSEEEVANLTIWDIIHPDSIPHCREIFQKVMSGEAVSNVEAIFLAKDGNLVTVE